MSAVTNALEVETLNTSFLVAAIVEVWRTRYTDQPDASEIERNLVAKWQKTYLFANKSDKLNESQLMTIYKRAIKGTDNNWYAIENNFFELFDLVDEVNRQM